MAEVCAAHGGFFQVARIPASFAGGDVAWCKQLAEEKGVVATPTSVFYSHEFVQAEPCRLVRLPICKSRETKEAACAALIA